MKEFAQQYLQQLERDKNKWEQLIQHAAWVDNGRGGSINKEAALSRVEAKIEAVKYLLSAAGR